MLKILVKVFKSLYLLNLLMDLVNICHDEILVCSFKLDHLDPLSEVTDLGILCFVIKVWLKILKVYIY